MHGHIRYGSIGMPYKHYDTQNTHTNTTRTHTQRFTRQHTRASLFLCIRLVRCSCCCCCCGVAGLDSVIKQPLFFCSALKLFYFLNVPQCKLSNAAASEHVHPRGWIYVLELIHQQAARHRHRVPLCECSARAQQQPSTHTKSFGKRSLAAQSRRRQREQLVREQQQREKVGESARQDETLICVFLCIFNKQQSGHVFFSASLCRPSGKGFGLGLQGVCVCVSQVRNETTR